MTKEERKPGKPGTYEIVEHPNTGTGKHGVHVSLCVTHTCGHLSSYYFGGKEFAEHEVSRYISMECMHCSNSKKLTHLNNIKI